MFQNYVYKDCQKFHSHELYQNFNLQKAFDKHLLLFDLHQD
jgi:hypothetical protein